MQATKEVLEDFVNNIEKMGYERGFKDGIMNDRACVKMIVGAYRNGVNDVWEAMAAILKVNKHELKAMGLPVSGVDYNIAEIVSQYSGVEVVNKVRAWKKREKVKVGDEITDGKLTYIITRVYLGCYDAIRFDGTVYHDLDISDKHKTGRSFDVEKILGKLRDKE